MAQGGLKKRATKFVLPTKKGGNKVSKSAAAKKGVKKPKNTESTKIKKNLQKAIGRRIEEELVTIAADKGTNFRIVNPAPGGGKSKKKTPN